MTQAVTTKTKGNEVVLRADFCAADDLLDLMGVGDSVLLKLPRIAWICL